MHDSIYNMTYDAIQSMSSQSLISRSLTSNDIYSGISYVSSCLESTTNILSYIIVYVLTCAVFILAHDALDGVLRLLHEHGHLVRNGKVSVAEMPPDELQDNLLSVGVSLAPCMVYLYHVSDQIAWSIDLRSQGIMLVSLMAYLMLFDTWFFFTHRAMHKNKTLFKYVHGYHHQPKSMYIKLAGHSNPLDVLFSVSIPYACWTWFCCWMLGNGTSCIVGMYTTTYLFALSHCGYRGSRIVALLCPTLLVYTMMPYVAKTSDHPTHHARPTKNHGAFFTFWDHVYGSHCTYKEFTPKAFVKPMSD